MEQRLNKPRVFLSHSKKNADFIEQLDNDLRKCQIDTWLDSVEIRHGKSWQDSIFQYGLPTCDAVIVYFTELSIQSPVVKKEIDVALLQNLKDNNIAFLPYVNDEKLRVNLRPDIQALQVPEWNKDNYHLLLPRVVAEIWRSYLERTVFAAVNDERLKRTQLELEMEKKKNQEDGVFSKSEDAEFEYITRSFDRTETIIVDYVIMHSLHFFDGRENFTRVADDVHTIEFNFLELFAILTSLDKEEYIHDKLKSWMYEKSFKLIPFDLSNIKDIANDKVKSLGDIRGDLTLNLNGIPNSLEEFRLYGLIQNRIIVLDSERSDDKIDFRFIYTEKFFRYRFWLAYHGKLANNVNFKVKNLKSQNDKRKI